MFGDAADPSAGSESDFDDLNDAAEAAGASYVEQYTTEGSYSHSHAGWRNYDDPPHFQS